jgi:hypothetical protein
LSRRLKNIAGRAFGGGKVAHLRMNLSRWILTGSLGGEAQPHDVGGRPERQSLSAHQAAKPRTAFVQLSSSSMPILSTAESKVGRITTHDFGSKLESRKPN